jgi:hypothetical protein
MSENNTNSGLTGNNNIQVMETEPEYTSHSHYHGSFDYNTNSYAKKERFINKTYIGKSNISGYGVFANEDISAGDVIEEFPVLLLDTTWSNNKDQALHRYAMTWDCNCNICQKNGKSMAVMFGNGSIYNHSEKPNAYIVQDNAFKLYRFYALTDIKKDTEITWYYSSGYAKTLRNEANNPKVQPEGLSYVVKSIQKGYQVGPHDYPQSAQEKKRGCGCRNGTINEKGEKIYEMPTEKLIEMGKARAEDYDRRVKEGLPVGKLIKVEPTSSLPQDDKPIVETIPVQSDENFESFMQTTTPDVLQSEVTSIDPNPTFRSMVVPENKLN